MSGYLEYKPHPALSDYVIGYNFVRRHLPGPGSIQRVLPDGCVEVNFCLTNAPVRRWDIERKLQPNGNAYAVSRFSQPYYLQRTGPTQMVGIRFHAWGIQAFTDIPAAEYKDRVIPLQNIFGNEALKVRERLLNSSGDTEAIAHLEQFLCSRLRLDNPCDPFSLTSKQIFRSGGMFPLTRALSSTGLSRRRIEQLFHKQIGVSPKFYSRLIRFQHSIRSLGTRSQNISQTAADFGYFDQPHFIRDFKQFSGTTPGKFLLESHPLSDAMSQSLFR